MKKEFKYQASDFSGTLPSGKKWAYGMGLNLFAPRNPAPALFVKVGDTWERATCKTLDSDDFDFLYGKSRENTKHDYLLSDIVRYAQGCAKGYQNAMEKTMYFRGISSDLTDEKYLELFHMWRYQNVAGVFYMDCFEHVTANEFEECMSYLFGDYNEFLAFSGKTATDVFPLLENLFFDTLIKHMIKFMKELADDDED